MAWLINAESTQVYIALPDLVVADYRKVSAFHATAPARSGGANHLTTARAGSVSLCFKNHKAQTVGHLAPGCEDELSGLDPANRAAFSFNEGHTETKGYSGGIGLCQLTVKHGIKTPTGSVTFPELQSTNCVKARLKLVRHARSSRRLAVDIATSMGGNDGT
jgi:hypothetical protein